MTPEERHAKIEAEIEKHNTAIQGLIAVGRTCLDSINGVTGSIKGLSESVKEVTVQIKDLRDAQASTDEKLNILIDTVDRIIRNWNSRKE